MTRMPPRVRKLALTAHIVASVGWLGGVAVFLALSLVGLTTPDADLARAAYLAMDATARLVLVPLSLAALATGLVQSLGTDWGLLRHYWVIAKLLITVVSTALLLLHLQPITLLADATLHGPLVEDQRPLQVQLVANAALALVALTAATALSTYKPRGLTRRGRRAQREQRTAPRP